MTEIYSTIIPKGMPICSSETNLSDAILYCLEQSSCRLHDGDVIILAQKIVSKCEGRQARLIEAVAGNAARSLAHTVGRDPALMQLILDEAQDVLRATPAAVIVRHRTGHVLANAGIDASNVEGADEGAVLLWPLDPDASARTIRADLRERVGVNIAVVIADSMGRAWRAGTVGTAIGCAGIAALDDRRGRDRDIFGRTLQATVIAVADAIAGMAVLAMGEGDQATPLAIVRGAGKWVTQEDGLGATAGLRPIEQDMFR